jgi:hypothetical protein
VLDIHNLERRWLKYKIKSYLPLIITLLISALLFFLTYIWSNTEDTPPLNHLSKSSPKLSDLTEVKTLSSNEETSTILEPSMDFIQSFQVPQANTPPQTTIVHSKIENQIHETIPSPKVLNIPDSTLIKPSTSVVPLSPSNKPLSLNRNDSKLDIESIERRFKETSNPNLGLFIAKYHYEHGNYSDAYNYSLKTNTLNSKIDESWIIFSKSLLKLGKVDQAKKPCNSTFQSLIPNLHAHCSIPLKEEL